VEKAGVGGHSTQVTREIFGCVEKAAVGGHRMQVKRNLWKKQASVGTVRKSQEKFVDVLEKAGVGWWARHASHLQLPIRSYRNQLRPSPLLTHSILKN
jgi:hypothetical protein